jgi:hypothetical protein
LSSQYRDAFRYAAVVHEPKAAGAGAGECLSSAIVRRPIGYENSPEILYFVAESC